MQNLALVDNTVTEIVFSICNMAAVRYFRLLKNLEILLANGVLRVEMHVRYCNF